MLDYIDELIESIQEVFQTMMAMDIKHIPDLKTIPWPPEKQYTAVVGLGGEDSGGLIYIHCDEAFAIRSTNAMLGMDVSDDRDSIIDALGEIANMIGGNFKNKVAGFDNYKLSLPSVIVGKDYSTYAPGGAQGRVLGFQCDESKFLVNLVLKK